MHAAEHSLVLGLQGNKTTTFFNPRHACAPRITVLSLCVSVCVCVSVTSLTATPLTYGYKVRYESKTNAVLKVFDVWILLKYFV